LGVKGSRHFGRKDFTFASRTEFREGKAVWPGQGVASDRESASSFGATGTRSIADI